MFKSLISKIFCCVLVIVASLSKGYGLTPVIIDSNFHEIFVHTDRVKKFVDSTGIISETNLYDQLPYFEVSGKRNIYNENGEYNYWLFFQLVNQSEQQSFVLEMYDFALDSVSVFLFKNRKLIYQNQAGYMFPFSQRSLHHKNFSYPLHITHNDTLEVFMKFKSQKKCVLKPGIKTQHYYTKYALQEYGYLGLFYGTMTLIVLCNLIGFFIVRGKKYLFYLLYITLMCIYFLTQDGLGFQYLWPNMPEWNNYLDKISLSFATIFLLSFSQKFLGLDKGESRLVFVMIFLISLMVVVQVFIGPIPQFPILLFVCFQACLPLSISVCRKKDPSVKWFIISFVLLNLFFFIRVLEYLDFIGSSIFTVYAFNFGIVSQFICLSVSMAWGIKESANVKNKALQELLEVKRHNYSLRLIELKRQMNPHFLFNVLNSIQSRILVNKNKDANHLLLLFSSLIRKNLEISDTSFISLSEEIVLIMNYLDIEKIRLGDTFQYIINVDPKINLEREETPTFLIQPIVENALWHGFSKKSGEKLLTINISDVDECITIDILDDGVGMNQPVNKRGKHHSKGLSIIRERISLLEKTYGRKISLDIISPAIDETHGTLVKIGLWK